MLRASLKNTWNKTVSPRKNARLRYAFDKDLAPPIAPTILSRARFEQETYPTAHRGHIQHDGCTILAVSQLRCISTSRPTYARSSFRARIQDKLQKLRKDENAMQKLMGVGTVGYGVAKMSKLGVVMKYAFPVLKLTKAMPLMSMALSTVFYSWFFGLPFAVGMVSLIFSSSASRALALKRFGCEVEPVTMVPFFGTISSGNTDYTKSEEYVLRDKPFQRCLVALSPVAGMFLFTTSLPFGIGGMLLNSQCGYAVANTGYMMAMFSQLPLGDMTPGGLLLSHFSKHALLLGTIFNMALLFVMSNPILYLCLFLNMYRLYQRGFVLFGRQFGGSDEEPNYESGRGLSTNVFSDQQKVIIASLYWALFVLNAGGLTLVGNSLMTPQRLKEQQMAEERERRLNLGHDDIFDRDVRTHPSDGVGFNDGGWNLGDWALGNLNTVEELDKEESDFDREWRQQQEWAANTRSDEQFRYRA